MVYNVVLPDSSNSNYSCGASLSARNKGMTPREFNKYISINHSDTAKPKTPSCFKTPIGASSSTYDWTARIQSGQVYRDNLIFNRGSHVVAESMQSVPGDKLLPLATAPERGVGVYEGYKNSAVTDRHANMGKSRNTKVPDCMAPRPPTADKYTSFERQRRTLTSREARAAVGGNDSRYVRLPRINPVGPEASPRKTGGPTVWSECKDNANASRVSSVHMIGGGRAKKDEVFVKPTGFLPAINGSSIHDRKRNKQLLTRVNLDLRGGTPWTYPKRGSMGFKSAR